ncbi:MAG: hypothetical protein HYV15_05310 [Elusimicrobia bacterium]|nr:hypothetical protein [Elusimicrobiota bacterium]
MLRARLRVRWLRACVKGRLSYYDSEARDKARRALWNAPLFPNADGDWLSYRQLVRLRKNFGGLAVVSKPRRWADLRVSAGGMRSLPVRAPHLAWRACREDESDLVRLFGAEAVQKAA